MARAERSFEVAGVRFRFVLESGPGGRSLAWPEPGRGHAPLCHAVSTAWLHSPRELLASLDERAGRSYEGAAGWAWSEEEGESPPGVTSTWLGERVTVGEPFFTAFVRAFARAVREAGLEAGAGPTRI